MFKLVLTPIFSIPIDHFNPWRLALGATLLAVLVGALPTFLAEHVLHFRLAGTVQHNLRPCHARPCLVELTFTKGQRSSKESLETRNRGLLKEVRGDLLPRFRWHFVEASGGRSSFSSVLFCRLSVRHNFDGALDSHRGFNVDGDRFPAPAFTSKAANEQGSSARGIGEVRLRGHSGPCARLPAHGRLAWRIPFSWSLTDDTEGSMFRLRLSV